MITTMLILFVVGYAFIAFEHKTGINKSAIALLMCGILWSIFSLEYPSALPGLTQTTVSDEILRHLGSTCEILVFLIGAMTIVDLIDFHGGFEFITRRTPRGARCVCCGWWRCSPSSCRRCSTT